MGTVGGTGGVGTGQLVQHPRGGSVQALKVVLGAANHCEMCRKIEVRCDEIEGDDRRCDEERTTIMEIMVSVLSLLRCTCICMSLRRVVVSSSNLNYGLVESTVASSIRLNHLRCYS